MLYPFPTLRPLVLQVNRQAVHATQTVVADKGGCVGRAPVKVTQSGDTSRDGALQIGAAVRSVGGSWPSLSQPVANSTRDLLVFRRRPLLPNRKGRDIFTLDFVE